MDAPKKILFVAMQNSPHACRWINSIAERGWDLHLFPVSHLPVLPMLKNVTIHPPIMQIGIKSVLKSLLSPVNPDQPKEEHGLQYESIYPLSMPRKFQSALNRISFKIGQSQMPMPLLHGPQTLAKLIRKLKLT